ncbi:papilin-like [Dermochelys coriacea]|uniref:papilin-like n=1 Tax=Dermochelys coriacea TaxID=27794 RepID=UPI001CA810BA|nr:papilin-like [Dermochelys coriacea]
MKSGTIFLLLGLLALGNATWKTEKSGEWFALFLWPRAAEVDVGERAMCSHGAMQALPAMAPGDLEPSSSSAFDGWLMKSSMAIVLRGTDVGSEEEQPYAAPTAKDGECPAEMKGPARPPQAYCLSDESCPGSEKCCSEGDRRVCVLPDSVHPGYCPKPDAGLITICLVSCSDDTQCSMDEKCCTIGCHRKCTKAEPASPGICPKRKVLQPFAPCNNKCASDRSCPGEQKCCFTGCGLDCVPPQAGALSTALPPTQSGEGWDWTKQTQEGSSATGKPWTPRKRGTCPPNLFRCLYTEPPLCLNDTDCRERQKCCYNMCQFRCMDPEEEKPGICPAEAPAGVLDPCFFRCSVDKDCLGSEKCCILSCGAACLEPRQDVCQLPAQAGLCDVYSFRYFYNASARRCEPFSFRGCRGNANNFKTKAECVQACAGHEKPGECPAVEQGPAGACEERCRRDDDCPGSQKCCGNGCGSECSSVTPEVRPGVCPALPRGAVGACDERCRSDSDCPGAQKCCSNGCGLACMAVALIPEVKPGVCSAQAPADSLSPCFFRCTKDDDCPGQEKCCRLSCGTACLEPKHGKKQPLPRQAREYW